MNIISIKLRRVGAVCFEDLTQFLTQTRRSNAASGNVVTRWVGAPAMARIRVSPGWWVWVVCVMLHLWPTGVSDLLNIRVLGVEPSFSLVGANGRLAHGDTGNATPCHLERLRLSTVFGSWGGLLYRTTLPQ